MRTWPVHDETLTAARIKDVLKVQLVKAAVTLPTRLACQACLSAFFSWAISELPPAAVHPQHRAQGSAGSSATRTRSTSR